MHTTLKHVFVITGLTASLITSLLANARTVDELEGAHRLIRRLIPALLVLGFTLCVGQSAVWATLYIGGNRHVLEQDLNDNIVINGDWTELDCANWTVRPNSPTFSGYGIAVDGLHGITIRNCRVQWWDRGISIENSSNIQLINNNATQNNDGYDINSSTNITIRGGWVSDNHGDGIDLDNTSNVRIESVGISLNNDKGITVNRRSGSSGWNDNITISQCQFIENGVGIRFEWVRNSAIRGNSFWDNGCYAPEPDDYCTFPVYPNGGHIVFKIGNPEKEPPRVQNTAVEGNYCRPNDVSQLDPGPCSVITER